MTTSIRPGDVLAGRYHLVDLLAESKDGRFWRAHDRVLDRPVAVHVIRADDERAPALMAAAKASARVLDRRILRVLDADRSDHVVFVVNEWGEGTSLDILLADEPLDARRAAWIAAEAGAALATAHDADVAHGRLVPENVLLDLNGEVRIIGLAVDAALHGLPPGRTSVDIVDLAGVLYAGLTARWPGVSTSAVPDALVEGDRVLRPRQVRAGIPRSLDDLCDQVLNPHEAGTHARTAYDLGTARGIADYLRECVGDPSDLTGHPPAPLRRTWSAAPAAAAPVSTSGHSTGGDTSEDALGDTSEEGPTERTAERTTDRPAPRRAAPAATTAPHPPEPEPTQPLAVSPTPDPAPAAPSDGRVDMPTEAGMPIFDADGDVDWLRTRSSPPPPPPPFEQPPERPLFAPEPPPGTPARRPRPGAGATEASGSGPLATASTASTASTADPLGRTGTGSQEFWPWGGGTGAGTGSGMIPAVEEAPVPGRRWLRLAALIAAAALLFLAITAAFQLGSGRRPLGIGPQAPGSSSAEVSPTAEPSGEPFTGLVATDFDPQGDPPEEFPDLAPLAVDGDPGTAWRTNIYKQNLGPGGLKTGLGLIIDLGATREVSDVDLTFVGAPTGVSIYLTDAAPRGVRSLTPVATGTADQTTLSLPVDPPASGRYVTVWLTSLPEVKGGFRGAVAEVVVRG